VDPRRSRQLDRASRLRVTVSVLLAQGTEGPDVVELDRVQRAALGRSRRVHVEIRSWVDATRCLTISVRQGAQGGVTEEALADAVDRALERFEDDQGAG
jgi:hypothetical protein